MSKSKEKHDQGFSALAQAIKCCVTDSWRQGQDPCCGRDQSSGGRRNGILFSHKILIILQHG
jgi:hypothetical protein